MLSRPEELSYVRVYRDYDCGLVGFHDTQGHSVFYPLNFSTLLQITTNSIKITIANIPMTNKARYRYRYICLKLLQIIRSINQ